MIGDHLNDIEAGARFGARGILVLTGHGAEAAAAIGAGAEPRPPAGNSLPQREEAPARPAHIAGDILAAVRWLLKDREK